MRLATWNVNSIRARVDRVVDWLKRSDVDVLTMQETKCKDEQFPLLPFEEAGYEVATFGLNQWNGVAIASRVGMDRVVQGFPGQPTWGDPGVVEARALAAVCQGVEIWSLYVPNGRTLSDPHYTYKLAWLDALASNMKSRLAQDPDLRIALTGDWNIAPRDEDVWDMSVFEGATHVSPPERKAFQAMLDLGLTDVVRDRASGQYTYWDYQQLRFPRNEGMRIDFILASHALSVTTTDAHIDRDERKGKGASDHVPVIVDFSL